MSACISKASFPHIQSVFGIESEEQFNNLFSIAHQELLKKSPGAKWHRTESEASPIEGDVTDRTEQLPSSFIRIDGEPYVLMLGPGDEHLLGQGTSAKVKLAIDKDKKLYAVKIFEPPRSLMQPELIKRHKAEHVITWDLHLSHSPCFFRNSTVWSKTRIKLYSVQKYLGNTLYSLLSTNQDLSLIAKLNLAMMIFLKVNDLHRGNLSASFHPYAHLDLKPDNILIKRLDSGLFEVYLIDFGAARSLIVPDPNQSQTYWGSPLYFPLSLAQMQGSKSLEALALAFLNKNGAVLCDLIALKRVCYLDKQFFQFDPKKALSIFNSEQFLKLSIHSQNILSTLDPTTTEVSETPLLLASVFACELLNAQQPDEAHPLTERFLQQLKQSDELQQLIIKRAVTSLQQPAVEHTRVVATL